MLVFKSGSAVCKANDLPAVLMNKHHLISVNNFLPLLAIAVVLVYYRFPLSLNFIIKGNHESILSQWNQ